MANLILTYLAFFFQSVEQLKSGSWQLKAQNCSVEVSFRVVRKLTLIVE